MDSFLRFVARRWDLKHEDVATEALGFLLDQSWNAREAFCEVLQALQCPLDTTFHVSTQQSRKGHGRPDMRLFKGNSTVAIVENKFGARLTDHQTSGAYLKDLVPGGVLLFIVPSLTKDKYWTLIEERLNSAGLHPTKLTKHSAKLSPDIERGTEHSVAIASWSDVIQRIKVHDGLPKDEALFTEELGKLCDVIEHEEFTPLTDPDVLGAPERFRDYLALANDIAKDCFGVIRRNETHSYQPVGRTWVGVYGKIHEQRCWIGIDATRWSQNHNYPIWIAFEERDEAERAQDVLRDRPGLVFGDSNSVWLPVLISKDKVGVDVLKDAVEQVTNYCKLLASHRTRHGETEPTAPSKDS